MSTNEEVEPIDTRAASLRYAALKALESGLKVEIADLGAKLLAEGKRLAVSSFASDFGKVTLSRGKPKFSVADEAAYLQHFRDMDASANHIQTYDEPDPDKMGEILDVLRKHAPHLIRSVEYVPEFLEHSFLASLEMREHRGERPILGSDGEPLMTEEINPLSGEVTETPITEQFIDTFVVQRVKTPVVQEDGSIVEEAQDVRMDFMSVTPGNVTLVYPASKEQKIAKAKAAAFFSDGDLSITREVLRPKEIETKAPKTIVVDEVKPVEDAPAPAPKRRATKKPAEPVADPTDEVVKPAPKRRAHRRAVSE